MPDKIAIQVTPDICVDAGAGAEPIYPDFPCICYRNIDDGWVAARLPGGVKLEDVSRLRFDLRRPDWESKYVPHP